MSIPNLPRSVLLIAFLSVFALTGAVVGDDVPPVDAARQPEVAPWNLHSPPRPFSPDCWRYSLGSDDSWSVDRLKRWLQPVGSHPLKFTETKNTYGLAATLSGLAHLRADWPKDGVLRVTFSCPVTMAIHLWDGEQGISLRHYRVQTRPTWAAYRITRRPGAALVVNGQPLVARDPGLALLTTDDQRTGHDASGTYTVRWQDGTVVLAKGDRRLMTGSLKGPPKAVFLESPSALLRSLAIYRGERAPETESFAHRVVLHSELPSSLAWKNHLPTGASLKQHRDGRVQLSSQNLTDDAWIATPLVRPGLYEVVVRLEDATPGTGIYFGDAQGRPREGVQFFRDLRSGRTCFRMVSGLATTAATPLVIDWKVAPAALAPRRPWLRLVSACGTLRCWTSDDGVHWGQVETPLTVSPKAYSHIVLRAHAAPQKRHIALRSLVVRELDGMTSLAPEKLVQRALSLRLSNPKSVDDVLGPWQQRILERQPAGVPTTTWRRACCIAALIEGAQTLRANALLEALLRESLADPLSLDHRLRILSDATLLCDTSTTVGAKRLASHFDRLAMSAAKTDSAKALVRIRRAKTQIVCWTYDATTRPIIEAVARYSILKAAFSEDAVSTGRLASQLRFWNRPPDLLPDWHGGQTTLKPLVDWGLTRANKANKAVGAAATATPEMRWHHPLSVDISKEAFNVRMELQAALKQSSYRHAARNITSMSTVQARGLVPDASDKRLFSSLPRSIESAVAEHPALRKIMVEQFGPVAKLRVTSAMSRGDESAVTDATICFRGMPAAGLAHRWLGERDLSRGKFIRALRHFDDALSVVGPVDKQQVLARQMLAAAMLGRRTNAKVTHDVIYGRYTLTPDEFHQLIDEMVEQHAVVESKVSIGVVQVPKPARYEVRPWTVLSGDVGINPQNVPATSKTHDWPARQMSTTTTGTMMIVSNRYQVTALRLTDGQVAWTYSLGKQQGQAHALPLRRLPLLLDADRVYAMLLPNSGRERLVCLDVSSGKLLWQLALSSPLLSNPVAIDGQLFIVASSTDSRQQTQMFRLLELEPETGSVQHDVALSDFRQKKSSVPFIQIAVAGSNLLLAFEGGLACCDTTGELLWVRHTAWVPPTLRAGTQQHERQPPLVTEHSIYLATPGMSGIECLDVDSGRRRWHQPITDPRRLLSVDSEQLLLETDHGIMALRIKDGQTAWRYAADDLLEVVTPADESKPLLCVGQYQVSQGESAPSLVWIDRRTGRRIAHHGLVDLRAATPRVGPIISRDGRTWCFAGTFDDKGVLLPQRQIVELVATEGEPTAPTRNRFSLWRGKVAASQSVASSDSDWLVLSSQADAKTGAQKEFAGRKNVLVTQANSSPVRLARLTNLPAESQMLVLEVCVESTETSHVVVRVGGLPAGQYTLAAGKPGAWRPLKVDLSAFAGREAWITIEHRPSGSSPAYAYWGKMSLEPLK